MSLYHLIAWNDYCKLLSNASQYLPIHARSHQKKRFNNRKICTANFSLQCTIWLVLLLSEWHSIICTFYHEMKSIFSRQKPDACILKMFQNFLSISAFWIYCSYEWTLIHIFVRRITRNLMYLWNIHFILCTDHYPCLQNLLHLSFLHAKSVKSCHLMRYISFFNSNEF